MLQARSDVAFPWKLSNKKGRWLRQAARVYIPDGPLAGLCQKPILEGLTEGFKILSSQFCSPMTFAFHVVNGGYVYRQRPQLSVLQMIASLWKLRRAILERRWEAEVEQCLNHVLPDLQSKANELGTKKLEALSNHELQRHMRNVMQLLKDATIAHRRFSSSVLGLLDLFSFLGRHSQRFGEDEKMRLIKDGVHANMSLFGNLCLSGKRCLFVSLEVMQSIIHISCFCILFLFVVSFLHSPIPEEVCWIIAAP